MPAPILDAMGRPLKNRTNAPVGGQAVFPNRGAWWDTLSSDITPSLIISYLSNADRGNLSQQMQLFDRMVDRDDRLQAVLETRKLAVTGVDRAILPAIPDDARAEKAADLVREKSAELPFEDILGSLLDGVPKGLQVSEIIWDGSDVEIVKEIQGRLLKWESGVLMVDTGKGNRAEYTPVESNKYIAFMPRSKPGPKERAGLLRSLSILWVAKHWALKDWAAFVEVFGMPLRMGSYPSNTTPDNKQVLYEALQDLGSDSAAMIPEDMKIEFPRAPNTGTNTSETPMEQLIDYADRCYAIRLLGQNTSTEGVSGSGTLAGGAHENVRKDYKKADARALAGVVEDELFRPMVGFNLGWDYPTPKLWLDVEDAQDDQARVKVYTELAKVPGMVFSRSQIREEFALREPLDEEDALTVGDDPGGEDINPNVATLSARLRGSQAGRAFSSKDDIENPSGDAQSSGAAASEGVTRDLQRQAQDDWIGVIFSLFFSINSLTASGFLLLSSLITQAAAFPTKNSLSDMWGLTIFKI